MEEPGQPQSKPGQMKVSKGQSQPEIVAAAFLLLCMVLGSPFLYQVLIVAHVRFGQTIRSLDLIWQGHLVRS